MAGRVGLRAAEVGGWWWCWGALAGLCVLAGSRWAADQAWPGSLSTVSSQTRACALAALIAVGFTLVRQEQAPSWIRVLIVAVAGAFVLAGQVVGAAMHGVAGEAYNRVVALCLVPVVLAVAEGARRGLEVGPPLVGLAGALLIFPMTMGGPPPGYAGLLAPVLCVAAGCVVAETVARKLSLAWAASALLGGGAAGLALVQVIWMRHEASAMESPVWAAVGIDMVVLALAAMALLTAGARRYGATFFAIPLLTIVEGALVMRPGWTWRLAGGILLLAAGSAGLLLGRGTEAGTSELGLVR